MAAGRPRSEAPTDLASTEIWVHCRCFSLLRPPWGAFVSCPVVWEERDVDDATLGQVRAVISTEMTRLHRDYYGRGPTKARTYIQDDLVVVVLEETFTRAERTLVERGEIDAIQQIRRRFQQQMAEEFTALVEQATGRRVRAFLSETNLEADVSVEIFLLSQDRTDMSAFEDDADATT